MCFKCILNIGGTPQLQVYQSFLPRRNEPMNPLSYVSGKPVLSDVVRPHRESPAVAVRDDQCLDTLGIP